MPVKTPGLFGPDFKRRLCTPFTLADLSCGQRFFIGHILIPSRRKECATSETSMESLRALLPADACTQVSLFLYCPVEDVRLKAQYAISAAWGPPSVKTIANDKFCVTQCRIHGNCCHLPMNNNVLKSFIHVTYRCVSVKAPKEKKKVIVQSHPGSSSADALGFGAQKASPVAIRACDSTINYLGPENYTLLL